MPAQINLREVAPSTVSAAIFDMDDLMVDSHPLHMEVFRVVLLGYGVDIRDPATLWTPRDEVTMFGLKISDTFKLFIRRYHLESRADPDQMRHQFDEHMLPVFERASVQPMPGLMNLIGDLQAHDIRLAIASSAQQAKIDIIVAKLGLTDVFAAMVSGEDEIANGKPAPDIFLAAARKLGVEPQDCMAFEDATNGVVAINAADEFSIGVHNQFSERRLGLRQDLSAAALQVNSLAELTYR